MNETQRNTWLQFFNNLNEYVGDGFTYSQKRTWNSPEDFTANLGEQRYNSSP